MPKHAHSPSNRTRLIGPLLALLSVSTGLAQDLLPDPSFEKPMDRNRWGHVFSEWYGNVYEGSSRFEVGQVIERFLRVRHAAFFLKHLLLDVGQAHQKMGVALRVAEHFMRQRTLAPIGALELF